MSGGLRIAAVLGACGALGFGAAYAIGVAAHGSGGTHGDPGAPPATAVRAAAPTSGHRAAVGLSRAAGLPALRMPRAPARARTAPPAATPAVTPAIVAAAPVTGAAPAAPVTATPTVVQPISAPAPQTTPAPTAPTPSAPTTTTPTAPPTTATPAPAPGQPSARASQPQPINFFDDGG